MCLQFNVSFTICLKNIFLCHKRQDITFKIEIKEVLELQSEAEERFTAVINAGPFFPHICSM